MRRRKDPKIDWLAAIPGFEDLPMAELLDLASNADQVSLPAGQRLTTTGDLGRECFVITAGEAEVTRDGELLARVGPGAVIGELALLENGHRSADVTAVTPVEVAVFDRRSFERAMYNDQRFSRIVDAEAEAHRAAPEPGAV